MVYVVNSKCPPCDGFKNNKKKSFQVLKGGVLVHFDGIVVDLINFIEEKKQRRNKKKHNAAN